MSLVSLGSLKNLASLVRNAAASVASGGLFPNSASITYSSIRPTLTGVAILFAAGSGGSISYAGGLAPMVSAPAVVAAGAGAAVTYTGGLAPDAGGTPDGAIVLRSGDYVVDRSNNNIINVAQS